MEEAQQRQKVRSVAIIGAGPSGLTAAKYLEAEQCFDEITLFERQPAPGGIWNYVEGVDHGTLNGQHPSDGLLAGLGTPLYRDLECNAPVEMMQFSDKSLPTGQPLFPPRSSIQEYLIEYAKDVMPMIRFNCEVLRAEPVTKLGTKAWEITFKNLSTGQNESKVYDALVVASGRQAIPRYPQLPGVQEWFDQHPGTISHSAQFDIPDPFTNKKILMIGNSTSGLDISRRLARAENPPSDPIYVSQRSKSTYYVPPPPNVKELASTVSLDPASRSARFSDGSSISDIEKIIFCTGYFLSYPFLGAWSPVSSSRSALRSDGTIDSQAAFGTDKPADSGSIAQNMYEYIFPYDPKSTLSPSDDQYPYNSPPIALVNTLDKSPFFKMIESQSAVIAGVFSGRLSLPPISEMVKWEAAEIESKGGVTDAWNTLRYPADVNYFDRLHDWASGARTNNQQVHVNGENKSFKLPKRWGDREKWLRTQIPSLRKAYMERGNERSKVHTIEQLGFHWEAKN